MNRGDAGLSPDIRKRMLQMALARRHEQLRHPGEQTQRFLALNKELLSLCKTTEAMEALEREAVQRDEERTRAESMAQLSILCFAYLKQGLPLPLPLVLMARDLGKITVPTEVVPERDRPAPFVTPGAGAMTAATKRAAASAAKGRSASVKKPSAAVVVKSVVEELSEKERAKWDPRTALPPFESLSHLQQLVRRQLFYLRYRIPQTLQQRDRMLDIDFLSSIIERAKMLRWQREAEAEVREALISEVKQHSAAREVETLRRLKAQNLDQYLNELKERKDDRIQIIVKQTHECLEKIMGKLQAWNKNVFGQRTGVNSDDSLAKSLADLIFARARLVDVPATLGSGSDMQLKGYQMEGLRWLASLDYYNLNGILADEMGLGKTVQTIAFLLYLKERGLVKGQHLIIAPSAVVPSWLGQLGTWAPQLRLAEWTARIPISDRTTHFRDVVAKAEVVVTTYDFIRDHQQRKTIEKWGKWPHLRKIRWHVIVVDEGHHINNNNSQVAKCLRQFMCLRKLLLTGTPLQNSLQELWALLNYLMPDVFSNDKDFEEWFQSPFGDDKTEMTHEEKTLVILRLHKVLAPFMLRRVKADVAADLPDVIERTLACELSPLQVLIYGFVRRGELPALPEAVEASRLSSDRFKHVARVGSGGNSNALRKVCNHPFLAFSDQGSTSFPWERFSAFDGESFIRASGKFAVLDVVLKKLKLGGHRILIYSPWTQTLEQLAQMMHVRQYRFELLTGASKGEDREQMISNFTNDASIFVFLVSTHAGGEGVNLQAADTVIIFESDWNPQKDKQAKSRVHRLGQHRKVLCLSLVSVGEEFESQDEKKFGRADEKRRMEEKVIGAGNFVESTTDRERAESVASMYKEEEQEGPTFRKTDQLDRLIARDEEELAMLSGHVIEMPPLLQIYELPDWIKTPAPKATRAFREAGNAGGRVKAVVNYREGPINSDEEEEEERGDDEDDNIAAQKITIKLKRPRAPPLPEEEAPKVETKAPRYQPLEDLFSGDQHFAFSSHVGVPFESESEERLPEMTAVDMGDFAGLELDLDF